jgi:hypothetical protein
MDHKFHTRLENLRQAPRWRENPLKRRAVEFRGQSAIPKKLPKAVETPSLFKAEA